MLVPSPGKGVYAVPSEAGQSIVALGVATADACVMAEEEDWVMEDAGGVVDWAVGLRGIISF